MTASHYLEQAAALIAKAVQNNETVYGPEAQQGSFVRVRLAEQYHENTLRLADAYATLAAIENGQVPAGLVRTILDALPANADSCSPLD